MSKYTTEIRFIVESLNDCNVLCGYNSVNEKIRNALPKIFDFDYPIFDENYRRGLEFKIIKHFYTREIGDETYGLFKLRLDTKMNEIMPYYNQLYESALLEINPLSNYKVHRTHDTNYDSERDGTQTVEVDGKSKNLYSDTPQGSITNLENETYLTTANIDTNENATDTTSNDKMKSTEKYVEDVLGYNGISASKLLTEYRNTFLNIDVSIINELDDLFMQLW